MNPLRILVSFLAISLSLLAPLHAAALELASPFTEHMVLQRDMKVPVWGWGEPGKSVEVSVADQSAKTTVNKNGSWKLDLGPLKAGGPYKFTVASGGEKISFSDVLAGEVWICSGQSNMDFGRNNMLGIKEMRAEAKGRPLRSMVVDKNVSLAHAHIHSGFDSLLGSQACGKRSALARAFKARGAAACPCNYVTVFIRYRNNGVVESGMNVDMATRQMPLYLAGAAAPP